MDHFLADDVTDMFDDFLNEDEYVLENDAGQKLDEPFLLSVYPQAVMTPLGFEVPAEDAFTEDTVILPPETLAELLKLAETRDTRPPPPRGS